ncbi:hypothetical protein D3C78_1712840 [compost metagenome]
MVADQRLDRAQAFADPVADPLLHLGLVRAETAQAVEYGDVVQRMDVAADQRRHAALTGALERIARQQRRLRVALLEVFDDRR